MATGKIVVQTRTARSARPVVGALVTVFSLDDSGKLNIITTERTDLSGSTPAIEVETPSLDNSSPEAVPPFAKYNINIDHPAYRPVTVSDVSVYSGVTTTVPVPMTPPCTVHQQSERIYIQSPATGPSGSGTES